MDRTNHIGGRFRIFGMDENRSYRVVKKTWSWVKDVPKTLVVLIGIAELLGALGLVLPWALNIAPVLTPIAAMALVRGRTARDDVSYLAKRVPGDRREYLFVVLALIVAIGRL